MDSATLPSAPRRMTGGERNTAQSESLRAGETKHKGDWCYAHWILTLCVLMLMLSALMLMLCSLDADALCIA